MTPNPFDDLDTDVLPPGHKDGDDRVNDRSPFDDLKKDDLPPEHEDGDDRVNDPPAEEEDIG